MRVRAQYRDSGSSGCIAAATVLVVAVGVPFLFYRTGVLDEDPTWWVAILQVIGGFAAIIAVGGLSFKLLSPIVQKLSDRGFRELDFEGARLTDLEEQIGVDISSTHVAHLCAQNRLAQLRIVGQQQKNHEIKIVIQGYSRTELLEIFDDELFVTDGLSPLGYSSSSGRLMRTDIRDDHLPSQDVTGGEVDLHEGFNLDVMHAGHTEIFEAICDALYRHRYLNMAYQIHSEFPWHVTPQPKLDGVRKLDLDDPDDAEWKAVVERQAHVELPSGACVSQDYLLVSDASSLSILHDLATLGRKKYEELVTFYVMPLGEVKCNFVVRTDGGGTVHHSPSHRLVHEIRGVDEKGREISVDISVGSPGNDRFGEENRNKLYFETLHRFINEMATPARSDLSAGQRESDHASV